MKYIGDGRSDCYQVYLIEATGFYSASVELATQSVVLAMIDSVRTSVCHSPVSLYQVKIAPATIMWSSLQDSPMTLVS